MFEEKLSMIFKRIGAIIKKYLFFFLVHLIFLLLKGKYQTHIVGGSKFKQLKASWHKKFNYMPHFFVKFLQAVCLGFVHKPDIGPINFQIIEHKFVQHCETQMDAQSCNASYVQCNAAPCI